MKRAERIGVGGSTHEGKNNEPVLQSRDNRDKGCRLLQRCGADPHGFGGAFCSDTITERN